jgi:hypothetical protein
MDTGMSKNVTRCVIHLAILVFFLIFLSPFSSLAQNKTHSVSLLDRDGKAVGFYRESHALVIGVSDYTGGWPRLPGVKKDVKLVREALQNHGFNVVLVRDPNQKQMIAAIEDFIQKYGQESDNRLLFYYSGHGHTLQSSNNKKMGYLVPVEAPNPSLNEKEFISHSLDMSQINVYAKRIKSKHALFLFDSCFAGTLLYSDTASSVFISDKISRPVRQFITAGTEEEEVPDESIFRAQFISGLKGEADVDNDGYLTGTELGMFLENTVVTRSNALQHPTFWKLRDPKYDKGDFVFPLSADITPPIPTELASGDIRGFTSASRGGMSDPKKKGKEILRRIRENFTRSLEMDDLKLCDPEVDFQAITDQAFDNGKSDLEFLKRLGNSTEAELREEFETLEQETAKTLATVISTRKYSNCYQRILGHYLLSGWINGAERSRAIEALKKNSRSTRGFWKVLGESLGDFGKRVLGTTIKKETAGAMSGLLQSIYSQADDILDKTQRDVAKNTPENYPQPVPEPAPPAVVEPPPDVDEPPPEMVELPPAVVEPPPDVDEPPPEMVELPPAVVEPPPDVDEPPPEMVELPPKVVEPPSNVDEPPPELVELPRIQPYPYPVEPLQEVEPQRSFAEKERLSPHPPKTISPSEQVGVCPNMQVPKKLAGHNGKIISVSFSPNCKFIASGSGDGTARIWNFNNGEVSRILKVTKDGRAVKSVSFSPDSKLLATGAADGTARVWDVITGNSSNLFRHRDVVNSVEFSPDSNYIATASDFPTVRILNLNDRTKIATLRGHTKAVRSVSFSSNGKYIASGSDDKTAIIWEVDTKRKIHTLKGHSAGVNSVRFSPDSRFLATGAADGTAKIWNANTGSELFTLRGHSAGVMSVGYSANGKYLVTVEGDNTTRIWDMGTQKEIRSTSGLTGTILSAQFSPDGRYLAVGFEESIIKITAGIHDPQ